MTAVAQMPERRSIVTSLAQQYGVEPDVFLNTVKAQCMARDASNEDFAAFLMTCKEHDLNPLLREIYALPKKGGGYVPVVAVDGWTSLINRRPELDGIEFDVVQDDKGKPVSVTCRIFRKDRSRPVSVTEYFSECVRPKSEAWQGMPNRMLRHKALMQCARYAFAISGIYDPEEAQDIVEASASDVTPARSQPVEPPRPALSNNPTSDTQTIVEPVRPSLAGDVAKDAGADLPPEAPASSSSQPAQQLPEEPFDFEAIKREIDEHLSTVTEVKHIEEVRDLYADDLEKMTRTQREVIEGLLQDAELMIHRKAEEESRKRIEAAGGKGIREYMQEDRQDAQLADEIRAGDMGEPKLDADDLDRPPAERDPFEEIADFPDDQAFAAHIRAAIAKAKEIGTEAAAKKMKAVWIATKQYRTLAAPVLRDQLFMEMLQAGDTLKGK
jgi:phage recombination protein Bet